MNYTKRLRDTREDAGDSQESIAKILKITRQQYQLYESGKRSMPIDLLRVFCIHYKISADYILGLPHDLDWPE